MQIEFAIKFAVQKVEGPTSSHICHEAGIHNIFNTLDFKKIYRISPSRKKNCKEFYCETITPQSGFVPGMLGSSYIPCERPIPIRIPRH
jgi:hypothetical protein